MVKIAEMVGEHCHGISWEMCAMQCIEIAEKVECYDVKLPGNISYCIEGESSRNTKQFIVCTALKIAVVNGGNILV